METQNIQYALICFDELNLLIPQADVATIETLDSIQTSNTEENNELGQYQSNTESWPVYSVSSDFIKLQGNRESDRYCVCFKHPEHGLFGLVCSAVSSFYYDENNVIDNNLPEMMFLPQSPIQKLLYYQNTLYLQSDVNNLYHTLVEVH